jgi:spore coat polysaccharide biosynthesis protein SpsF
MPAVRAFVQARMSSRRFPGKVLAPFRGQPIVRHVVERIASALPDVPVVVATSVEPSDDPLAAYLASRGIPCHRGPLGDVFARFRGCLLQYPCDWVLRVTADSPVLEEGMLQAVVAARADGVDLVTTTLERSFPRGSNAELIRAAALAGIAETELTEHDREHVTPFFHRHPQRFRLVNVKADGPSRAHLNVAVDTIEDLERLERGT